MSLAAAEQVLDKHKNILLASLDEKPHTEPEILDKLEKHSRSLKSALTCLFDTGIIQPPALYLCDLSEDDVYFTFPSLHLDTNPQPDVWGFVEGKNHEIPSHLALTLRDSDLVYQPRGSPTTSVLIRTRLNNILVSCISAELRTMGYTDSNPVAHPDIVPLTLRPGKCLKYSVKHQHQERLLQGLCDYSMCYRYGSEEDVHVLSLGLVLYETKKSSAPSIVPQCLGYMGIMHNVRKRAGVQGESAIIYGLSTDSFWFYFLRINDQGQVSDLILNWRRQPEEIYSVLRTIIRHTAQLRHSSTTCGSHSTSSSERLGFSIHDRVDDDSLASTVLYGLGG